VFYKDGGFLPYCNLKFIEVNAWCEVFSHFVAVGMLVSVGVICSGIFCL